MALNVTINALDDETNHADVTYEDTTSGITFDVTVILQEEFVDENALLDFLAMNWPHSVFEQKGKASVDRHVVSKGVVGSKKSITGKVQSP